MNARPDRVFDVRAAIDGEDSGGDEIVERGLQELERRRPVGFPNAWMVGNGKRGVEQARFGACELEIRLTDRSEPESRTRRGVRAWPHLAHAIGHASGEFTDRFVADGGQERVTVVEMPVGGVGDDADHARDLAQHDRVRAPRPRELETGLHER
jgi:hypothetical protein